MRKKLGECLIQAGLISADDLQTVLAEQKRTGEELGSVLVRMKLASEKQITKTLAHQLGFSYINLAKEPPEPAAIVLIPKDLALKRVCVAVRIEKNLLTVAMADPLFFSLIQDLEFQTGYRIKQVVATKSEIRHAIETAYPDKAAVRVEEHPAAGIVPAGRPSARVHVGPGLSSSSADGGALVRRAEDEVFESDSGTSTQGAKAPQSWISWTWS